VSGSEETPREARRFNADRSPTTALIDGWCARNTFHSQDFADLERLVRMKAAQGLTISLGLPALNEEQTIGTIIGTLRRTLVEEAALLDEIVLIDSGSTDCTRHIATELGVPVVIHQKILPQHGSYEGKGEALWKSLYVLEGDILVWIDTDIANIDPHFVYGTLGPLLSEPRLQYVKGFYRRPLQREGRLIAGGGGRVTELTARPLINLFFPHLSGLIQPLSGEYAGRREALEQLPFFTGYGVELGLLIDMVDRFGLEAVAQVDLLRRVHRNQPLCSLSEVSFAVIQVIARRLEDRHQIQLLRETSLSLSRVHYAPGRPYLEAREIRERQRPPMVTVPEYQHRRALARRSATRKKDTRP